MSAQLVTHLLALDPINHDEIKLVLSEHKDEIDEGFVAKVLEASDRMATELMYDDSVNCLRLLAHAGNVKAESKCYLRGLAFYHVANVERARNEMEKFRKWMDSCVKECDGMPRDPKCRTLKADALYIRGCVRDAEPNSPVDALADLQSAKKIYADLGLVDRAEEVRMFLENRLEASGQVKKGHSIASELEDIRRWRSIQSLLEGQVLELQTSLQRETESLSKMRTLRQELEAEFSENVKRSGELAATIERLVAKEAEIREWLHLFSLTREAPLWVAAVRADMRMGVIADSVVPMLEKLRAIPGAHAEHMIAEICARNKLAPEKPIPLDDLTGEARLFAGLANARSIQAHDPGDSLEVLLSTWETFLQTTPGENR